MLPVSEPEMYEIEEYAEVFTQEMLDNKLKPDARKMTREILEGLNLPMRYRQEGLFNWVQGIVTNTIDVWINEEGESDA